MWVSEQACVCGVCVCVVSGGEVEKNGNIYRENENLCI